jgi:NAD(P)-dependent dehydrogenase (short-subunit alcohol dehydrogenase family)
MSRTRFAGKVALVTGGGSGIGAAAARALAAEGAAVGVLERDRAAGQAVVDGIAAAGGEARLLAADVAVEAEVAAACETLAGPAGGIDVLVNNAAVFVLKGLEATPEDWQRSLAVNVMGAALAGKHAAAAMKRRGGGAIVNIGSISSFIAQRSLTAYSVTKAAVLQMTRNMAMDLAPFGIRVNCVCPGPIATPALWRAAREGGRTVEAYLAEETPKVLLGRVGEPEEVAHAVLFLASAEASYITGASLLVDGGYTAQ